MKDYSAMNDGEINFAVAEITGESAPKVYEWGIGRVIPDYCNNPADAWPIIQKRGISLNYDGIDWIANDIFTNVKASNNIETHAGKPLRAAMICYLKALDVEKGHG